MVATPRSEAEICFKILKQNQHEPVISDWSSDRSLKTNLFLPPFLIFVFMLMLYMVLGSRSSNSSVEGFLNL